MNKILLTYRLLLVFVLILVACSSGSTPSEIPAQGSNATAIVESDGKIPVRWFIGIGTGRSDAQMSVAQAFVQQYNASQERIELILEAVTTDTHDAIDHLLAEIDSGSAPDLVAPAGTWGIFQFPEYLLPLDAFMVSTDLSDLDPEALKSWQEEGKTIGFPLGLTPSMLFYNKALFEIADLPDPPHQFEQPYTDGDAWTIEKMEEIALKLTRDVNGKTALNGSFDPKRIAQWGFHWQWDSTSSMAVLFGAGSVVDEAGNASIPDHWRAAFHWYYAGMWEKYFIPNEAQTSTMQGNPFKSGKVGMINSFLWYAPRIASMENWDLAAVPAYNGKVTTRGERNGIVILSTSQHPSEAFEVAVAIARSPELLSAWGILPSFQSVKPSVMATLKAQMPDVDWQVALESLNYCDSSYEANMPNYRQSYDRLLEFRDLISSKSELDLYAVIDQLTSDLRTLFTK